VTLVAARLLAFGETSPQRFRFFLRRDQATEIMNLSSHSAGVFAAEL
jgi:hypothetical protein